MPIGDRTTLLRSRTTHEAGRVTFVELFFDLVFVFAVTQLSHNLLDHLTVLGFVQTMLLFMGVWWVWIDTSWATNWVDPQTTPARLMLFVLMLAGLVLSISIPQAFSDRALMFAIAYAAVQIIRNIFMLWALRGHSPRNYRNFQRITSWQALAAAVWVGGAFAEGDARLAVWTFALAIEFLAPAMGYFVPRLGRSTVEDWDIAGDHMAERCGLFIIIALGESILVMGSTFGKMAITPATIAAFVVAFVGSVAMWWIYFNIGAEKARQAIAGASDPGRLGRLAYTYFHVPIVAGIIVSAVADEAVLAHPGGTTAASIACVVLGGPALYLFGNILFKRAIWGRMPLSHLGGLALLAALIPVAFLTSPLVLATATTLVLVIVAIWETRSLAGQIHELAAKYAGEPTKPHP
jgi:low temperature requirement protein LtrA